MNHNHQNILVIHPADPSTDFLSIIYKDINATVIRQRISKNRLKRLMVEADKIIILGHGTCEGMGFAKRVDNSIYITNLIDSSLVYILRDKKDGIFIWCNADQFVKKYNLQGLSTGMFISEISEAETFCIKATESEIRESNNRFAELVRDHVHKDCETIKNIIKQDYVLDSDVSRYNCERIYNFKLAK